MKKLFVILLSLCIILSMPLAVSAEEEQFNATIIIDDQARLLTNAERTELALMSVVADFPFTIVISTTDSLGTSTPEDFANNRYDHLSGAEDGILLLVAMESRDWYILTVGQLTNWVPDVYRFAEGFLPDLSEGEYYTAFDIFVSDLSQTVHSEYTLIMLLVALGIGIAVGGIVILIMRSKMNTAKPQRSAAGYIKDDSFDLQQCFDFYLYSRVTKTPRSQSNSSGGSSRSGGGGKF